MCPVSILIHPGALHDSKIFDETLKELKRRRIIKPKNILLFDKGYFSYDNYNIGINRYQAICIIFPTSKHLKTLLLSKIKNWKEFKPIRGKIEDFFKVTKEAFGLDKLHKYTPESISKHIYLAVLLTTI